MSPPLPAAAPSESSLFVCQKEIVKMRGLIDNLYRDSGDVINHLMSASKSGLGNIRSTPDSSLLRVGKNLEGMDVLLDEVYSVLTTVKALLQSSLKNAAENAEIERQKSTGSLDASLLGTIDSSSPQKSILRLNLAENQISSASSPDDSKPHLHLDLPSNNIAPAAPAQFGMYQEMASPSIWGGMGYDAFGGGFGMFSSSAFGTSASGFDFGTTTEFDEANNNTVKAQNKEEK